MNKAKATAERARKVPRTELKSNIVPITQSKKTHQPWYEVLHIPVDIIQEAQVVHVTDEQARKCMIPAPVDVKLDGDLFPYINRETGFPQYFRVRRDKGEETRIVKGKKVKCGKYIGNAGKTHQRILYQHRRSFDRPKTATILLVEAEKSVLAIEAWLQRMGREDIVPLGMGGCWGWKDSKHGILPDLAVCYGRKVIVLLDSNIHTNKDVREAELHLTSVLRANKCVVSVSRMPKKSEDGFEDVNGPDDLFRDLAGDAVLTGILRNAKDTEVAPYSEHGLADRFAIEYKDDALYVTGIGWYWWDGTRWKRDTKGQVEKLCQRLCNAAASEREEISEQNKLRSRKTREAVMREAQVHMSIGIEELDNDTMLLNTPGGAVDLRTGSIRAAEREDYCTKITKVAPGNDEPRRWLKFLDEITLGDKPLQKYLQRLAGQSLTGDTSEQEFYFFHGDGMNGKGEFMYALMSVLKEYAAVAPMEAFMAQHNPQHPTTLAALVGARLVTASEAEDGQRFAESRIKELTGGTPIKVRFMRQDEFEYLPQFKIILAGNGKPRLRDVGTSMQRRLMLVPFLLKLKKGEHDKALRKALREEYEGILRWAIKGCLEWQKIGMKAPNAVTVASSEYFESQDVLGTWLNAMTVTKAGAKESSTTLYTCYKSWCEMHGEPYVMAQREFSTKLEAKKFVRKKRRDGIYFFGLRLRG